jgi:hypothetical protein
VNRFLSAAVAASPLLLILACGSDGEDDAGDAPSDGGPPVCAETPPPQKPAASCDVTIEQPPLMRVRHLPEGTPIQYCSNPPSSGQHYPVWAAFKEYTAPVDWPYLVHSIEHGAVALLYKCEQPCPEIVDAFRQIRDALPTDPLCDGQETPRRIIIAPSTTINTPVAATAWGATYQAACVDTATLDAFIREHYAKGPENFCYAGRPF